jgi:uncharacterized protein (TIGR00730 family)
MQKQQTNVEGTQLKKDVHAGDIQTHLEHIQNEFKKSFEMLRKYPKSVTMFGSSMIDEKNPVYTKAQELSKRISEETSYTIVTGGGPGIMEACNKGAFQAHGQSVGFNESLPHDHKTNEYLTDEIKFSYFFSRKAMMTFTAEAFIFFPGGFGTFDELFSVLTLIQTDKIPCVPVILFDTKFWNNVVTLFKEVMIEKFGTIREKDLKLFTVTDSPEEVVNIIKNAPVSDWWRNLN